MAANEPNMAQNICGLCNDKQSKYCCPRCEVLYCSLDCYKSEKHSQCSESFYRECVNEELATYHADDESKHKMIDILKRMQDADVNVDDLLENESIDSDDGDGKDLHERIQGLNLDDADSVWNALTEDERNEFETLFNEGDIGSILPHWEPWWKSYKEKKMVEDVDDTDEKGMVNCPEIKVVPELSSLTKAQPSPTIRYNITNVLASYAFVMRYYNGEIDPVEGALCVLNICANLDSNTNFEDPEIAVESVAQKCLQSELIQTDGASLDVMKADTFFILRGPSADNPKHYSKAALSHLHEILSTAKSTHKLPKIDTKVVKDKTAFSRKYPEHTMENFPKLDASKVKKMLKKIEYYLSFLESYSLDFE